ncbi:hypothetical protein CRM22_010236 [Opisthorchis felineus]|uniref:Major facilitator superfamily (MFS) profile domain-containing protein n=1 Tax=Opisthorchis felineus TaxID=147828 RepID=A0A4S2L6B4_OPIFE|nr:hypothetical protein CRM22_010236 [Opisthorchis felineus]
MNMVVSEEDAEESYGPTVVASVGPFVCTHYLSEKEATAFRGAGAVIGAFLLHLTYGHFYTTANMVPYIMGGLGVWLSITSLGIQSVCMPLGGLLCSTFGYRWIVGLSCLTESVGVFITYFSIKRSFLGVIITYSLLNGAGLGLGYTVVLAVASSWFTKQRGCVFGIVAGGLGLSTLVFTPIQTAYMNPSNVTVDSKTGLFKDEAVLDRVPSVFFILGGCLSAIQIIGYLLLAQRPTDLGTYTEPETFDDLFRHMSCVCCPCRFQVAFHQKQEGQVSTVGCSYSSTWEFRVNYHAKSSVSEERRSGRNSGHEGKQEEEREEDQVKVNIGGNFEQSEQVEGLSLPKNSQNKEREEEPETKTDFKHTEESTQKVELNNKLLEPPGLSEILPIPNEPETQSQIATRPPESVRVIVPEQQDMQTKRLPQSYSQQYNRLGLFFLRRLIRQQQKSEEKRKYQNETMVLEQPGQQPTDIGLLESDQGLQPVQQADSQDDPHEKEEQRQNRANDRREALQSMNKVVDYEEETIDAEEWRTEAQPAQTEQELLVDNESQEPCRNISPYASSEQLKTSGETSHVDEINHSPTRMLQRLDFYLLWLVIFFGVISLAVITDTYTYFGQKYISDDRFIYFVMVISIILNSLGRILWGVLVDKLSFKVPLCIMLFFSTTLLATFSHLSYATGLSLKILYTIWVCLVFIFLGGFFTIMPMAVSTIFGQANMAVNYGIIFSAQTFASILSGLITTFVSDSISYVAQFTCCSVFCVVALCILLWIEDRKINPFLDIFPRCHMRKRNFDDGDG